MDKTLLLQKLINEEIGVHYDTDFVCIHYKYCNDYGDKILKCHGYIEQADNCFKFKIKEVECPQDKSKIHSIPMQN